MVTITVYLLSVVTAGIISGCLLEAWAKRHTRKLRFDGKPVRYKPIKVNIPVGQSVDVKA